MYIKYSVVDCIEEMQTLNYLLDLPTLNLCFLFILPPLPVIFFFFFNDTPPTEIYPLPLHAPLPISAIMFSLLTAAVSGVLPALRASRLALAPVSALKDEALNTSGGIHKSRLAGGLVVGQIALSMLLLVCAGLLVSSLQRAQDSNPGFDPSHVFLASFDLKPTGYSRAQGIEFDKQILVRLKSLPGVQSVTLGDFSPLSFNIRT